jgi:hypothetical protein
MVHFHFSTFFFGRLFATEIPSLLEQCLAALFPMCMKQELVLAGFAGIS